MAVHVKVLVGCTVPPYKADFSEWVTSWLETAEELRELGQAGPVPYDVDFFLALEVDARGNGVNTALLNRLGEVGGWRVEFRYDSGADYLSNEDRLNRICMGRNLVTEQALIGRYDAILFLDSDVWVPGNSLARLLQVQWPIVGGHVPTYCLAGPNVTVYGEIPVVQEDAHLTPPLRVNWTWPLHGVIPSSNAQVHWNTAGFLLVHRPLFRRLRWYWDLDDGLTDDPAYQRDARELLGFATVVLHDVVGEHRPQGIGPLHTRGHDLTLRSMIQ